MNWIKTSEREPETNEDVLVLLEDEKRIYIGFMDLFGKWHLYDYSEQLFGIAHEAEDIPYWMPLPDEPEVEE